MKTNILALGFSLALLLGNAAYGGLEKDSKDPIHTLEPFVVYPHVVKLLNGQKLEPVDYEKIIRTDVEEISRENRRNQVPIMITFDLKEIYDLPVVAAVDR